MSKTQIVDSSPTLKEWPVRIWEIEEIPDLFAEEVRLWMQIGRASCRDRVCTDE